MQNQFAILNHTRFLAILQHTLSCNFESHTLSCNFSTRVFLQYCIKHVLINCNLQYRFNSFVLIPNKLERIFETVLKTVVTLLNAHSFRWSQTVFSIRMISVYPRWVLIIYFLHTSIQSSSSVRRLLLNIVLPFNLHSYLQGYNLPLVSTCSFHDFIGLHNTKIHDLSFGVVCESSEVA